MYINATLVIALKKKKYSKPKTVLALEKYFCSEATLKKKINFFNI